MWSTFKLFTTDNFLEMKSVKETVMICALIVTLLLVANVQRAEADCCRPNGGSKFLGIQISGGEKDFSSFI